MQGRTLTRRLPAKKQTIKKDGESERRREAYHPNQELSLFEFVTVDGKNILNVRFK